MLEAMGSSKIVYPLLVTIFVWIMAVEARIFDSNISLMYGEIEASLSVIRNTPFGFGKGGTLKLSLSCPPTAHDVAIPVVWLLACTTLEARDVLDLSNSRSELNSQACQKFEKQADGPGSLCTAFPVNLRWATPNGSFWHTAHLFTESKKKFFKFLMLQCPGRSRNSSYSYVKKVQCKHIDTKLNFIAVSGDWGGRIHLTFTAILLCEDLLEQKIIDRMPFLTSMCWMAAISSPEPTPFNFTLLNDFGTNHLSKDEGPLLYIYKVLTGVWSIMLLVWFCNWIQFRKYSSKLHKLLCIAPVVKFVQLILTLIVWERIRHTGLQDFALQVGCYVVQSTEDAMLFMTMMLASEGWCVLRPHIKNIRCALIPVLFLVFLGSVICVVWVHTYFMAFAVCSIVFVIYRALKWCSYNLDILHRQLVMTTQFIMQKEVKFKDISLLTQLMQKRLIYLRLRLVCAVFTMVFAVVATMSTFLTEFSWIKVLAFEIPELMVYFCLGMIFRLRDFGPYEDIEVITPKEKSVIFLLPHPDVRWPMRQKLVLGSPMETPVDEVTEEDELLKEP